MARELPPRYTGRRGRAAVRILTTLAWLAVLGGILTVWAVSG